MNGKSYCAVYDFELMPYALGDVLTWNVQTAIRAEELGRSRTDVFVCMDDRYPASIYQKGMVTAENCGLFLNELFGAFGTHPSLGNLYIYRNRESMLERLHELAKGDAAITEAVADYERALASREDEAALIEYFTKYIYFHEGINAFAEKRGHIPHLKPSMGCEPDVSGLTRTLLADKRIVVIHTRLRRLDAGYAGAHTYARDSDFLEWHEFLREANEKFPDVRFIALGRLQEKPLEMLRLPNVISLREFGLGLGHELTLMLHSDLFIGTSSGFAAMANFSALPYFITRMTRESCNAYRISQGAERLPFANERQILVYEPETRELLMRLLERGLAGVGPRGGAPLSVDPDVDVRSWEWERSRWLHPGATTSRFFTNEDYSDKETAFLLWPKIKEARAARRRGRAEQAWSLTERLESGFPRLCSKFPEYLRLKGILSIDRNDLRSLRESEVNLERLATRDGGHARFLKTFRRYLLWSFPLTMQIKRAWGRRHRVPRKLRELFRRYARRLQGT